MRGLDTDARTGAIEAHLPLVRSIARRYAGRGEPLDDLVQAGTVGLIKAVDSWDPDRGRDLAALARPAIEGEIRHHLRDGGSGPHVARGDRDAARATGTLQNRDSRDCLHAHTIRCRRTSGRSRSLAGPEC